MASIPSGRVLSYGKIAWLLGYPHHARLVGRMLHNAGEAEKLPCHRVVNSAGRTAPDWAEQRQLTRVRRCYLSVEWMCRYEEMAMETR